MKAIFVITTLLTASISFAETLTYKADFEAMRDTDKTSLEICDYPVEFKIDAQAPLAQTFIQTMFGKKSSLENIQATTGAISSGEVSDTYRGDYREKVYLVKQVIDGAYKPGIYYRVQLNSYGSTAAPKGFVANTELLNHRYSAELAEGSFCGDVYYKLAR